MSVVYVSAAGQDSGEGTAQFPFKTLTRALQQAQPGSVIQLSAGTYQANEQFPLRVPAGVTVAGASGQAVVINGGGSVGEYNVAVVLGDRAQIRELTLSNPQGSGVFTAEGAAVIVNNRLTNCQQHGILVAGNAHPFISKNTLSKNGVTGLCMIAQSKGEVRQNQFEQTGDGLTIHGQSAPLVIGNQLIGNRCAIVITSSARPVLRKNKATASQESGLWIKDRAEPDIGQPQDLGHNQFAGKTYDLRNDAAAPIVSAGNTLNPVRVQGKVSYLPSEIPDESAVPAVLLGNVTPTPPAAPKPGEAETPASTSLESRFDDLVGHWSAPFVEALADRNLIKGFLDGTFQPDSQVTRAQFAALVAAAFPDTSDARANRANRSAAVRSAAVRFQDVPASFWAAQAIQQAQTQGFISGFPDGTFRPDAPLTRVQAIVAVVSGLALGRGRSESLLAYSDRAQIPSYAIEPVAAATERQLIVSYPDPSRLRPLVPISRAETTALVHQALVAAGKLSRIQSPFILQANLTPPTFADLPAQQWAKAFIDPLVQKGWLSGFPDGSFRPDAPMTRAQFAALLVGAFDPQPKRPALRFRDVPDSFWAADMIQRAYRAQFLSGFPDLRFDPNDPLTKLQALLALVSGLNLQAAPLTEAVKSRSLQLYADRADIPSYAVDAIATATQLGLVFNRPVLAELRPNRAASRAEVSAMVYQALVLGQKMPAIRSADQVSLG
jgi:parallel beta-helix repeat protein